MCISPSGVAVSSEESRSPGRTCSRPSPSIASTARVSARATAAAPVSSRRYGTADSAAREVSPPRRCGSVAVAAWSADCIPAASGVRVAREKGSQCHAANMTAAIPIPTRTPSAGSISTGDGATQPQSAYSCALGRHAPGDPLRCESAV